MCIVNSWKESLDDPSFSQLNRAKVLAAIQAEMEDEESAEVNFIYAQSIAAQSDPVSKHYAALLEAYQRSPAIFRKSERNSANRAQLRATTGLTHQQLKRYIMFEREPAAKKNALIDYFSNKNQGRDNPMEAFESVSDSDPEMNTSSKTPISAPKFRSSNPRIQAKSKTHHRKDRATRKMMHSTGLP